MVVNKYNLAYDLSLFDPAVAEQPKVEAKKNVTKLAKVRSEKHSKRRAVANIVTALFCAVLAFGLIYSNAQMTELSYDIKTTQNELAALQNEQKRRGGEIEKKFDLRTIEALAKEQYGMQKRSNQQVIYLSNNAESHAVLLNQQESSLFDKLLDKLSQALDSIQAYFS